MTLLSALFMVAPQARAAGNVADLVPTVSAPGQVIVGDGVNTGATFFNGGPHEATGALFVAKLTGPGQYDAALSSSNCLIAASSVTCKLGNIPVGITVASPLVVDTTGVGTIAQSWAVTASEDDPTPSDNSGTVTTTVLPHAADLAAAISGPTSWTGQTFPGTTASVTDLGPLAATGIVLTDTFSGPGTFDAATSDSRCSSSGQTIKCSAGSLAVGATAQFTIAFALTAPGTFSQTVNVSAPSPPDQNPSNDAASLTTAIFSPSADLAASVSGPVFANPGQLQSFTVSATYEPPNLNGPVSGVVLTDTFSGPGTLDSVGPGCSASGQTITCPIGSMAVGSTFTVTIWFMTTGPGTFTQTVEVGAPDVADPNPSNNSASLATAIPSADLGVVASGVTVAPGAVTVHLLATNFGPDDVAAVRWMFVVSASSPVGVTLAGLTGINYPSSCITRGGLLCEAGPLPNGGSATVDYTLNAPSGTTVTITASVSGNPGVLNLAVFDANLSNNSASVTVVIP